MTGSVGTSVKPSISQQNHEVLERIRHHLDDQEHKIHEQLNRFQLIKKYGPQFGGIGAWE